MSKIIPKFGLFGIPDTALGEYADDKRDKINAVAAFAAVNPSTATVDAQKTAFENALVKSINGTKADTALKDQERVKLENMLTLQSADCAKIANGDLALYLRTGYEAKDTQGSPTGPLPVVTGLELFYGDSDGELKAIWNPVKDAQNFTVQAYSDISNPAGSLLKEYIIGKIGKERTILSALPTGQKVFVRVRANGGSTGQGPWSDPAEKRVPYH